MGLFLRFFLTGVITLLLPLTASGMGLDFGGGGGTGGGTIALDYMGETGLSHDSPPSRIACSPEGSFFVTRPERGTVEVFSNNGLFLYAITGLRKPVSVGVSGNLIFIGEKGRGSVGAFDQTGRRLYSLGAGDGEFDLPSDIITLGGRVYVTDSGRNEVRVYSENGGFLFSFGNAILSFPTGIGLDETGNNLYITENGSSLIRVFSTEGTHIKDIATGGKLLRPQGLVIRNGKVYVTDAYHSVIAVFDLSGNFLGYAGEYGTGGKEFRIPLDICADSAGKFLVSDSNNFRIQVLGSPSAAMITPQPAMFEFRGFSGGGPVSGEVTVGGTEGLSFQVDSTTSWLSTSPLSGTVPSSLIVTADPAGLRSGDYTGKLIFRTPDGTESIVSVNIHLESLRELSVTPAKIDFTYQKGRETLPSARVFITSSGAEASWTAATETGWTTLSSLSGLTPSDITISLNDTVRELPTGDYGGTILIDAGDTKGSPGLVNLSLHVVEAGTLIVDTNRREATFSVSGKKTFSGSGFFWRRDDMPPGDYWLKFSHIPGFHKPPAREFSIRSGETVRVEGLYSEVTKVDSISVASAEKQIRIFNLDGSPESVIPTDRMAVRLAPADIDGDGIDEIIGRFGKKSVMAIDSSGRTRGNIHLGKKTTITDIAAGDMDGDGQDEILIGIIRKNGRAGFSIYGFNGTGFDLKEQRFSGKVRPGEVAICDLDGDGLSEPIIASGKMVLSYKSRTSPETVFISGRLIRDLSCSDIDDDGMAEIILLDAGKGKVRILVIDNTGRIVRKIRGVGSKMEKILIGTGEINGDGVEDILLLRSGKTGSELLYMDGDGQLTNLMNLGRGRIRGFAAGRFLR